MKNIFSSVPDILEEEIFEDLLRCDNLRIERIISKGHASPKEGWYDQKEHEWVLVLKGSAIIAFEDGREIKLVKGDYLNICAHEKHRVKWTDPEEATIWLALFYSENFKKGT